MDVRIGISDSNAILEVEMPSGSDPDALKAQVADAIGSGSLLWLTDKKGKQTGVPGAKIAFVNVGTPDAEQRIGFGA